MRVLAWPAHASAERNPYQTLLYSSIESSSPIEVVEFSVRSLRRRAQILHVHWPDVFLAAGRGSKFWLRYLSLRILFVFLRLRGTRIVWTMHNLQRDSQRNSDRMRRWFWPWFLGAIDGVIYLNKASRSRGELLEPRLKTIPTAVVPHGHYLPVIPGPERGNGQGPVGRTLIVFGSIVRYKRVGDALEAFLQASLPGLSLHIVGSPSVVNPDEKFDRLIGSLAGADRERVVFEPGFVDEVTLSESIRHSSGAIFAYAEVLSSGAALYALSVGRPVLVPDAPAFRELREIVGADWVRLFRRPIDGRQIGDFAAHADKLLADSARPDLSLLDWEPIAAATIKFYERVLGARV